MQQYWSEQAAPFGKARIAGFFFSARCTDLYRAIRCRLRSGNRRPRKAISGRLSDLLLRIRTADQGYYGMSSARRIAMIGMVAICIFPGAGGATAQTAKTQEIQAANNFLRLIAQGDEVRFSIYNQDGDLSRNLVTVTWATQNGCSTIFDGVFGEGAPARRKIDWRGVSQITLGDFLSRHEAPDQLPENLNSQIVEVGPGGVTDASGRSQSVVFRFVGALAPRVYKTMKLLQADCASSAAPR